MKGVQTSQIELCRNANFKKNLVIGGRFSTNSNLFKIMKFGLKSCNFLQDEIFVTQMLAHNPIRLVQLLFLRFAPLAKAEIESSIFLERTRFCD